MQQEHQRHHRAASRERYPEIESSTGRRVGKTPAAEASAIPAIVSLAALLHAVLDLVTGEYEVDRDNRSAFDRADAKRLGAPFYLLRVGYPTAVKLGIQVRPRLR